MLFANPAYDLPAVQLGRKAVRTARGSKHCPVIRQQEITARQRAEAELTRQVAELRHSNAELQQFAYIVSHDLQQPLFAVTTALELLATREQEKLEAEAQQCLDSALAGSQQLQALLADLLAYARVGALGKPLTPTDSGAVWQQTLRTLGVHIADSQATITTAPLPLVSSDTLRLTLLFQNLLSNALKFQGLAPPRIHVWAQPQGAQWVFAVQDNGIGIEAQYAERIFEVLQRVPTPREYPGTGMGLAICKKIVEQHGGRIWVDSEPGQGATFCFTLPAP
jgi:light-regulated signal transduction histidine kinase (bacteriophytochrome)